MAPPKSAAPTASATPIDWIKVRTLVAEAYERSIFFHHPTTEGRFKATLDLMQIASGICEYVIALPEDLREVWTILRSEEHTLDAIMDTTSDMLLLTGYTVEELARPYAATIHAALPRDASTGVARPYKESISDQGFMESIATPEELGNLLVVNPWILTILILKRSGRLNLIRSVSVGTEPETPAAEGAEAS
jgi:hypothetical protein